MNPEELSPILENAANGVVGARPETADVLITPDRQSRFLALQELKLTHQYQMDYFMALREKESNEVSGRIIAIKLILNPLSPDYEKCENVRGMLEIELRELSKQIEALQDRTKKSVKQLKIMQQGMQRSQILAFIADLSLQAKPSCGN